MLRNKRSHHNEPIHHNQSVALAHHSYRKAVGRNEDPAHPGSFTCVRLRKGWGAAGRADGGPLSDGGAPGSVLSPHGQVLGGAVTLASKLVRSPLTS